MCVTPRIKVLVVGQTPPPFHGQAIMIERLLVARFSRLELCHVRMAFSSSIADVGRVRPGKLLHLELEGCRSVRVGRLRIVYRTNSATDVVAIGPRETIYADAGRSLRRSE
jgi:mRNA-degrading endonuclease RelE of RelBE toxin-antitoxin system